MLNELRKKTKKSVITTSILLFIIGIALTVPFIKSYESYFGDGITFEALTPDEIEAGMYVNIQLKDNFGYFMEEYSENTKTHVRTTEYLYYIIWTGDDNAIDYRFMGIRVPAWYERKMDLMADNTYEEIRGETLPFNGYIREMTEEDKSFFKDCFIESGLTVEEYEEITLPYYIEVTESKEQALPAVMAIAGLLLVLWGVIRLIKSFTGGFLKKFYKDLKEAGFTVESLESDYEYSKSSDMKISGVVGLGQRAVFYMDGAHPRVTSTKKLLWAYTNITQHRTYGIPTGKTYGVAIFAEGRGNFLTVGAKNEADAKEILQYLVTKYPWMIVGYSEELRKLFTQDLTTFKSLKYDKEISNTMF